MNSSPTLKRRKINMLIIFTIPNIGKKINYRHKKNSYPHINDYFDNVNWKSINDR